MNPDRIPPLPAGLTDEQMKAIYLIIDCCVIVEREDCVAEIRNARSTIDLDEGSAEAIIAAIRTRGAKE